MSQTTVETPSAPQAPVEREAPPQRRRAGRRVVLLMVLLVVAAVALAVGIPYYLHSLAWESTDDAFIEGHIIQVSARISGHVAKVLVDDNQEVKKGDVLVELDPADYQARVAQERASLAAKRSAAVQAQATVAAAEAGVAQARAQVVAAEAQENRNAIDLQRIERLLTTSSASPQEQTNAQAAERASAAQLDAARKGELAAEAQVAEAKAAQQTAEAEVTQAEATLRVAELNLSYTQIHAAEDGRVTRKAVEAGQYVQTGQAMMALVPRDFWVTANFKETQLTDMKAGDEAVIKIDAYPGVTFHGHVDSIQSGSGARFSLLPPENATGNYVKVVQRVPVKIVFDQPPVGQYALGPGMSVVPDVRVK